MKHIKHRVIFEHELDHEVAYAYTTQYADQIESDFHKKEDGVIFMSQREALYLAKERNKEFTKLEDDFILCGQIMERDRLRIQELQDCLAAVVHRYETSGSVQDLGVSFGLYKVCKSTLEKK
jgi:hypothetical protein